MICYYSNRWTVTDSRAELHHVTDYNTVKLIMIIMINDPFAHGMPCGILAPGLYNRCKSNAFVENATNMSILVIAHQSWQSILMSCHLEGSAEHHD